MRTVHPDVSRVTDAIARRSAGSRDDYLRRQHEAGQQAPNRQRLSCGNLAHGFAACEGDDKNRIRLMESANLGIVTAYNDMLSAHQPYSDYPDKIKAAARELACTAQVAGGVPAMCDGVTQGMPGMELSLFSRDVIAQATAVALSHQMFDAVICLGICDKIVPGLLIGALHFGHLPMMFLPAGPMPSGLPNKEKQRVRQLFAEGKVGRKELLEAEAASYHSAGTCTFYGTANSNQLLMEAMGLQLPGGSFVNPGTPLREALNREAVHQLCRVSSVSASPKPLGDIVDVRAIVNAMVVLLASGGSTNHGIHLIAIARAAGFIINWSDLDALSRVVPLLARVYPNGQADINHFHAAGGSTLLFRQLMEAGLMHADAPSMWGQSMADYLQEPVLDGERLRWQPGVEKSGDPAVIASVDAPFDAEGGLRLLEGNLGRALIKVSAVDPAYHQIDAPAVVIGSQGELQVKFDAGELDRDCVIVLPYQGPQANGMPELHKLTPVLSVLQDRGHRVALLTDGRMSGASGKVPAAIHLSPEAAVGGAIARLRDGDRIILDAVNGELRCDIDDADLFARAPLPKEEDSRFGVGRELFAVFRSQVGSAEQGASVLFPALPEGLGEQG
ncbi:MULTISPECIES: phosphogluconate dehydratase [Spongiibacter]|uniref:phosphogluconate dehydratase n=1 Tax=Spongiibacter TaxID=630749 RepID=UPI0003B647E9|nr:MULTISPECIES: phosphogluconate dehydratase [Spongiibacter]MBU72943.1 phosphogluconate dehydratase [Spongiibacter sp.]